MKKNLHTESAGMYILIHRETMQPAMQLKHFVLLKKIFLSALLLLCFTVQQSFSQALTGTKTIGGTSPDYSTLAAAITALNTNGVGTGGVTFNFRDGTYAGGTSIAAITASGTASNPILFQSENLDASLVTISSSTSADVVTINGGDYITFKELKIDYTGTGGYSAIELGANSDNITIDNCILSGSTTTSTSFSAATIYSAQGTNGNGIDNFVLKNSTITEGGHGIYFSMNATEKPGGLVIENNLFEDYNQGRGISLTNFTAIEIKGNTIRTSQTGGTSVHGIYIEGCAGKSLINGNYIYTTGSGLISYGIRVSDNCSSTSGNNSQMTNNSIQVYNSSSLANGISISYTGNNYWDIMNNTVYISGGSSTSNRVLNQQSAATVDINIVNNVFVNGGTSSSSYIIYLSNNPGYNTIDYNCYWWTTSPNYSQSRIKGSNRTTFSAHTTQTGETNSLNIDPVMSFTSGVGWKATASGLTGAGDYLSSVPKDIDGTNRLDPTTIGSHENGSGSSPLITVSTGSLSQFRTHVGTPTSASTFTVEGENLTANLVVTAPTNFELREQGVGSYGSSVSFTPSSGTVSTKTIEVRYNPGAAGSHSGNVTNTSTGATQKDVAVTGISSSCTSPFSGTYTINGSAAASCTNYQTFAAFVSDLLTGSRTDDNLYFNGPGIAGAIVVEVANGTYTESFELTEVTGASSTNTITFRPATGATVTLTSSAAQTINLNEAKYIIFDGRPGGTGTSRNFTIANTSTSGQAIQFINEAQYNTFNYCIITGINSQLNVNTRGVIRFSTSTNTNGNSNNTIENSQIRDGSSTPRELIYAAGTSGKSNSGNTISNNEFFNFYQSSGSSYAINIGSSNTGWTISNNHFYQTSSRTPTGTSNTYVIYISNTSDGNNFQVTENYIGGSTTNAGGSAWTVGGTQNNTFVGIFIDTYEGSGSVTSTVYNNTVANFDWTSQNNSSLSYPGIWVGIYAEDGDINIGNGSGTGNMVGSATGTGSISIETNTDGPGVYGILSTSAVASKSNKISYNTIGSVTVTGSSTSNSISFFGIYANSNGLTISNNLVGSTSTANSINAATAGTGTYNTQRVHGIELGSGSGTNTITNNTIANLNSNYAGTDNDGDVRGIVTTAGEEVITGNIIYNLSTSSANTGTGEDASISGISQELNGGEHTISQNEVYAISNTSSSGDVEVNGIYFKGSASSSSTTLVERNFIHSLTASTSGAAKINGIQIQRSSVGAYRNNIIRLGIDGSGNSIGGGYAFTGILVNSEDFNPKAQQIYFNTVYIGGTNTTGSAVTAAYKRETAITSTPPNTENIKNNIFFNERSNSGGSGTHYAIVLPAATSTASDYNVLQAKGTGGVLGSFNGTDYNTITGWRTATGFDANSWRVAPVFINVDGNADNVDLHLDASSSINTNYVKDEGTTISGITGDYEGATRTDPPTIGAMEYDGSVLPVQLTYFAAEKINDGLDAALYWHTAAEVNSSHFDIEVYQQDGLDGEIIFKKIGEVKGSGTSTVAHDYSFTDTEKNKSGVRYYRLRQVDSDGSYTYSEIKALEFGKGIATKSITLYPNPTDSKLNLSIHADETSKPVISIQNIIGQEIYSEQVSIDKGLNGLHIDISTIPQGVYILVIKDETGSRYEKFEKF